MANDKNGLPEEPGTQLDYAPDRKFSDTLGLPPVTGPLEPPPPEIIDQPRPPYISGTIDVGEFVKAQSAFIAAQSTFTRRANEGPDKFLHQITQYSLAQDEYIRAMTEVLHDLGVV